MKPATGFARPVEHTGDPTIDRVQRARNVIAGVLNNAPFLRGLSTGAVSLAASTPVAINHKLGRQPVGWLLTDVVAASPASPPVVVRTAWDGSTITLQASQACTIVAWVF